MNYCTVTNIEFTGYFSQKTHLEFVVKKQMAVSLWFMEQSIQEYDDRVEFDVFVNNFVT